MTGYKTLKQATALALILGLSVVGAQAMAAGSHGDKPQMRFETLDANSDGKLSREELKAAGEARFAMSDSNGDGKLSREEAVAKAGDRAAKRFDKMLERLDDDDDGTLTQTEMNSGKRAERMDKMFARADADGDGFLSEDEAKNMRGKHGWRKRN